MRAFVAGATGYTGREVVRELRERGIDTVAHIRPDSPILVEWRKRFEELGAVVDTTPWNQALIRDCVALHAPSHIFALLGTTRARAKAAAESGGDASYDAVDYGMTSLLLKATSSGKFIYLSSLGVQPHTRNPYFAARARIETELKHSGLSYVIARPAFVTGSDREEFRFGERTGAVITNSLLNVARLIGLGVLHERFASLTGKELGRALVNAALDGGCVNVTLEAAQLRRLARR